MTYIFKFNNKQIEVPKMKDITWGNVLNKPTAFAPSSHSHNWNSVTSKPNSFIPSNHNHNYIMWTNSQYHAVGWMGFYDKYNGTKKGWIGHNGETTLRIVNEIYPSWICLTINGDGCGVTADEDIKSFRSWGVETHRLGVSWAKWQTVYARDGTISTSDETKKKNISALNDKYYQLAEKIDIISYQFKDTNQEDNKARTHIGAISQRVEETLFEVGLTYKDFAGFCKDQKYSINYDEKGNETKEEVKGEYDYSLRYDELSMLKIWYLEEKMKKQQNKINELENMVKEILENKK